MPPTPAWPSRSPPPRPARPRRSPSPPAVPIPPSTASEIAAQLEEVRAEHEEAAHAIRAELAATVERLERDRERERSDARAELSAALERVEQVQRGAEALRERLTDAATTDQLAELRQSVGTDLAALRESLNVDAARSTSPRCASGWRASTAARTPPRADVAALRDAVAGLPSDAAGPPRASEAAAASSPRCARRSRVTSAAREIAALREAVARHEAATGELATLREAVARHGPRRVSSPRCARPSRA